MASDEERRARELAEELDRLRVEDVLIQTLVTASALGYRALGVTAESEERRDLGQARIAIETMRALIPVLGEAVPAELLRDLNASVASLQLAYAQAVAEASGTAPEERGAGEAEDASAEGGSGGADAQEPGGGPGEGTGETASDAGEGEAR